MIWPTALVVGGVVILAVGGEVLVRGASGVGLRWGLSATVIGLTVVSFATSAPELAVTIDAVLTGSDELAIGNVLGSNVANLWLVLGVGALLATMTADREVVVRDLPVVIVMSALFWLLALDGALGRGDGLLLLLAIAAYVAWCVRKGQRAEPEDATSTPAERPNLALSLALVIGGVALLTVGARTLVSGATSIAASLGLSELVIGLTVVAFGTSLPELTATVVAVLRRHEGLGLGNAVGSNIANIGFVLGVTAVALGQVQVSPAALRFDLPLTVVAAVVVWAFAYVSSDLSRVEGLSLVILYAGYLAWLVLDSTGHDAVDSYRRLLLASVPLFTLAVGSLVVRQLARRSQIGDRR